MKEDNKFTLRCDRCKKHVPAIVDGLCKKCRDELDSFEQHDLSIEQEKA